MQPLIERTLDGGIDTSTPLETYRTADNRQMALTLPKEQYGTTWQRLFRGDSDGLRCMQPPCTITETDSEVTLEFELPFWIEEEDVQVDISSTQLSVFVRAELSFRRRYWRNSEEEQRNAHYAAVDVTESLWSLDADSNSDGQKVQLLTVSLVRPPLTADEVMWKKGRRMDNRAQERPGGLHQKGVRFFVEDEDEFGLEDTLQAQCFQESGSTFVPAKPWQQGVPSKQVSQRSLLSAGVQQQLQLLGMPRSNIKGS